MAAQRQVGVDALLGRLSRSSSRRRTSCCGEGLRELGQRRPAPQGERPAQRRGGGPGVAGRQAPRARRSRRSARERSTSLGRDLQRVPRRPRAPARPAGSTLRSCETWIWTILGAVSGGSTPQRSSTRRTSRPSARAQGQRGEERPLLAPAKGERATEWSDDLERPQDAHVHDPSRPYHRPPRSPGGGRRRCACRASVAHARLESDRDARPAPRPHASSFTASTLTLLAPYLALVRCARSETNPYRGFCRTTRTRRPAGLRRPGPGRSPASHRRCRRPTGRPAAPCAR